MVTTRDQKPASKPLYETDLTQKLLPEILLTIHRYQVPGVIECRRGDEFKRIFLDRGHIIFATTNQMTESLGDKLLREGKITRAQYDASIKLLKETGKRHGVTMVEMKMITPETLFAAVREQIQEIVWSVFGWSNGQVTFSPGRDKSLEFVKVDISVPDAIMRGVRNLPDAKALASRLGSKSTVFARTGQAVNGLTLGSDDQRILDAIDGRKSVAEVAATPPLPPADNVRILYGLHSLGLIAAKDPSPIKVQIRKDGGKLRS